ncbi:ShlB/FhaC/HecB family hemolysin secretion/activation protein [Allosphingosinicella vermicomposti]|uniref:ShlB/FhaC/HecB family hemolysin secretion/activation protein n=1 Tax=Allosphingosinicella vermicomposti TaxID=614671 RepID=UPI000D111922|nr:ShlB/FhaC/HecB family hemolysin secretion/activation protein [Allosphingosinicella vermicomposti]
MHSSFRNILLLATAAVIHAPAFAQVERNLPPGVETRASDPIAPDAAPASEDATPFGFNLARIVVLGPADTVVAEPTVAVDVSRVARLNTTEGQALLAPYIGKPMSRLLIAQIEADIARFYRAKGYPFVSLSTPEQEVTTGTLNVRVVEFTAGAIDSQSGRTSADYIVRSLRQKTGEPIDATALEQDLDWLNRNPFRRVEAVFAPGAQTGASNLSLLLNESKPWRVYAGAANSGSSSERERLFAGFQVAPLSILPDATLSYQFTGSTDIFDTSRPNYVSHAGILNLVMAPRNALEATFNHVRIRQDVYPFSVDQKIVEGVVGWRQAVDALGDMRVGVELRNSRRKLFFFGIPVDDVSADVRQFYIGLEKATASSNGRTNLSVTLHASPGGIGTDNSDGAFRYHTGGRVTDSTYAYVNAFYSQSSRLGSAYLNTEIIGQYATGPLPDSEQMGLGGPSLIRGYGLEDGGYDSGVVVRHTLFGQGILLGKAKSIATTVQPYLFADSGYGKTRRVDEEEVLAAIGGGFNLQVDRLFNATLEGAYALADGPYTQAEDWRLNFSVTFSY